MEPELVLEISGDTPGRKVCVSGNVKKTEISHSRNSWSLKVNCCFRRQPWQHPMCPHGPSPHRTLEASSSRSRTARSSIKNSLITIKNSFISIRGNFTCSLIKHREQFAHHLAISSGKRSHPPHLLACPHVATSPQPCPTRPQDCDGLIQETRKQAQRG